MCQTSCCSLNGRHSVIDVVCVLSETDRMNAFMNSMSLTCCVWSTIWITRLSPSMVSSGNNPARFVDAVRLRAIARLCSYWAPDKQTSAICNWSQISTWMREVSLSDAVTTALAVPYAPWTSIRWKRALNCREVSRRSMLPPTSSPIPCMTPLCAVFSRVSTPLHSIRGSTH